MGVGCYGGVCRFRSADFASWEAAGSLYHAGGGTLECPDFFAMPGGVTPGAPLWVLKASPQGVDDRYTVVRYNASDDTTAPASGSAAIHGPGAESQLIDYGAR